MLLEELEKDDDSVLEELLKLDGVELLLLESVELDEELKELCVLLLELLKVELEELEELDNVELLELDNDD